MINQKSIDEVYALDLVEVIGKHVDLKKKGSGYKGLSPFTDEKTPSFNVSPSKNIWHCFSSGKGGSNVVRFYMALKNLDWLEAIEELAAEYGIELERENWSEEQKLAYKKQQEERKTINQLLEFAASYFQQHDLPENYNKRRQYKKATLKAFRVGFAPDDRDAFYKIARPSYSDELLIQAGLCRKSETTGEMYDYFRNRIMFPICDAQRRVVAFAGRLNETTALGLDVSKATKAPKYINSPDTVWDKSSTLYMSGKAIDAIIKEGFAYEVEGYTDVQRFHDKSIYNVVAACGTALTEVHIKLLRRHTENVCVVPDNDIEKCLDEHGNFTPEKNAGIVALHRAAELLIEKGMTVYALIPGNLEHQKTGEGSKKVVLKSEDPDSWLQKLRTPEKVQDWLKHKEDYITTFLLRECEAKALIGPKEKSDQMKRLGELINRIPDEVVRTVYYDTVCAEWKGFKASIKLEKKTESVNIQSLKEMKAEQKADFFDFQFVIEKGQYYVFDKGTKKAVSNFTIEVLFFVISSSEPKYVCKFTNMFGKVRITAVTTDDFTSSGTFKKVVARLGNFRWKGKDEHLDNIVSKLFQGVKESTEPQYMGYNANGNFYTWGNGIYFNGHFYNADKHGIVTLKKTIKSKEAFLQLPAESQIEIGGEYMLVQEPIKFMKRLGEEELLNLILDKKVYKLNFHYLPFATTLKITFDEDDDYEFERNFKYFVDSPELDFNTWAKQIHTVYGSNGDVIICFFIASLYRDIIFKANENFPLLDHYGMPRTGKSAAAKSLARMFGNPPEDGVNLVSGSTETGIRRYMSSVSNGIIWLNEFKNGLSDRMFELLKSIFDGSGKLTGRKTQGNQTKTYKPRSSAIICGQDIPTREPALTTRCIFSDFAETGRNHQAYDQLKTWEKAGSTTHVTCQMLNYRQVINGYKKAEPQVSELIRKTAKEIDLEATDRATLNAASLLTPIKLLMEQTDLEFPFTFKSILKTLVERMAVQASIQLAEDDVEKFFTIMAATIGPAPTQLREGEHYMIKRVGNQNHLFLRLRAIHPYYQREARMRGIIDLGVSTLQSYIEKHPAYLETKLKNVRFTDLKNTTSAIIMNYDKLRDQGVELLTAQELDVISTYEFFENMLNAAKPGHRFTFESIEAQLTKHERSNSGNDKKRIVREQVDNYLIQYIQNAENQWDYKSDGTGITIMTKVEFE